MDRETDYLDCSRCSNIYGAPCAKYLNQLPKQLRGQECRETEFLCLSQECLNKEEYVTITTVTEAKIEILKQITVTCWHIYCNQVKKIIEILLHERKCLLRP